ncbi:DUF885 family protein [uncultured Brevundimonas sp.]|uniref:DUF885 domain-containing protein n=1 Tax=uncultured Brevundimonas sp. TaxID=213418 RepID=UPI00262378F8|nr:DUF885 family protein [uncultured Brevundimonas sp.]
MDRRRLLQGFAAGAAFASLPMGAALAAPSGEASATFHALLDKITQDFLLNDPTALTAFGMDRGDKGWARYKLSDNSPEYLASQDRLFRETMQALSRVDRNALSQGERVWFDWVSFYGETSIAFEEMGYGVGGYPSPYRISQLTGQYQFVPDFMRSQHRIEESDDAEAYLARLEDFAVQLEHDRVKTAQDQAMGVIPPDFIIQKTLTQMRNLVEGDPSAHSLVSSLVERAQAKGFAGDWARRATAILAEKVYPAVQKQIELYEAALPRSTHDAGAWKQPRGDEFYARALRYYTSTDMSADEIHQVGLDQVAELTARTEVLLQKIGLTQGTVGERVASLSDLPGQVYPNTDEGKKALIDDLNRDIAHMDTLLPQYFGRLPKSPVEVRRIPAEIEIGAPGGYYMGPALDGSRPGAFYINLRDTAEVPKFTLRTLTWHEASPGHHFQVALGMEQDDLPLLFKGIGFSANLEGWGLYAEQLADEMGVYKDDPLGEIGYLQSLMFRASRLVVDTGMHAKRWSREQAIRYMVDVLGDQESNVTTEVERYCVWTGQACAYKVGHNVWARLRRETEARLGSRFDIRAYHDFGLALGPVPLSVLEREIGNWNG